MRKIHWASMLLAGAALFTLQAHADSTTPSTTIGGKMYTDLTDITQDTNGVATDKQGYGLDIKRFYIGVKHVFDSTWEADFTTDITYDKNGGYESPMVKTAYVQATINKAAIFQMGSANMPWIPFDEDVYGYRFVENTLIDRLHFGNSADYGVHFLGKSDGNVVGYNLAVVDGCGYKHPCRSKRMDFEGRVDFMPVPGLILAADAYTGTLGADTSSTPNANTASRQDALIAYKTSQFTIAGEYFHADNFSQADVIGPQTDSASGYSIYGDYVIADNGTAIFARYDNADPSKDLNPSEKDKYYNFGISFPANSKITWALVYKHEDLSSNTSDTTTKEFGVWAQIKF